MSESTGDDAPTNSQDLTIFVQSLLEQMQSRFGQMSDAIIGRIDEMGNR
jgi:heat shock factor-binding protein 1